MQFEFPVPLQAALDQRKQTHQEKTFQAKPD
jgi:hypothetical protein